MLLALRRQRRPCHRTVRAPSRTSRRQRRAQAYRFPAIRATDPARRKDHVQAQRSWRHRQKAKFWKTAIHSLSPPFRVDRETLSEGPPAQTQPPHASTSDADVRKNVQPQPGECDPAIRVTCPTVRCQDFGRSAGDRRIQHEVKHSSNIPQCTEMTPRCCLIIQTQPRVDCNSCGAKWQETPRIIRWAHV